MDIKGIFDQAYEGFCYQNCIRVILNSYQLANYDFYINMSLSTKMKVFEDGMYEIGYDKDAHGIIPSCQDKVLRQNDLRNPENILEDNLQRIREGYPIINCVDGYYLEYFPYFNKKHCRHNFILTGENCEKNCVTVLDWYTPHFYQGEVKKDNYFAARSSENPYDGSIYSGSAIKNNWAIVLREDWYRSVSELILELIELSLEQYYHARSDKFCRYGVEVYNTLLEKFEEMSGLGIPERKEGLRYMHQELYGSVKRKKLFLYFLTLFAELNDNRDIAEKVQVQKYMNSLVIQWEKYLTMLLKASFRGTESDINILRDMLKHIILHEEGFYDSLLKLQTIV